MDDRGTIHDVLQSAESRYGSFEAGVNLSLAGNVALEKDRLAAAGLDFASQPLARLALHVRQGNPRPLGRKSPRRGGANPRSGAADPSHLIPESAARQTVSHCVGLTENCVDPAVSENRDRRCHRAFRWGGTYDPRRCQRDGRTACERTKRLPPAAKICSPAIERDSP